MTPKNTGRGSRAGALGNDYGKWPLSKEDGMTGPLRRVPPWRRLLRWLRRRRP